MIECEHFPECSGCTNVDNLLENNPVVAQARAFFRSERGANEEGEKEYAPIHKDKPNIDHISCWNFYPDPNASGVEDAEYVIERHKLNRQQLRKLKDEPYFNNEAIEELLENGPNYEEKYFEGQLQSDQNDPIYSESRYEVLEYWGVLDASMANEAGLESFSGMDSLSSYK